MLEPEIMEHLTELFHDLFGDDGIVLTPQTTADDVEGWDSIKHISLVVAVEDRFGIKMRTAEIDGLKNVGDLVAAIQAKLPANR
jgi:acyl carrier protein